MQIYFKKRKIKYIQKKDKHKKIDSDGNERKKKKKFNLTGILKKFCTKMMKQNMLLLF